VLGQRETLNHNVRPINLLGISVERRTDACAGSDSRLPYNLMMAPDMLVMSSELPFRHFTNYQSSLTNKSREGLL
jgi:hypothetical protein